MKVILAVMCSTYAVVKIRPEKKLDMHFSQLNYKS